MRVSLRGVRRLAPLSPKALHGALLGAVLAANILTGVALAATDRASMMRLTADHWIASQSPDGTLPYGFDLLADTSTAPKGDEWANVVRQVLSTYAWAQYYGHSGDRRAREPIQRALSAIGRRSLPIGKSRVQHWIEQTRILSLPAGRWRLQRALDRLGLLYEPAGSGRVVSPNGKYGTAVTGATAVALLAELAYSRASGDHQFASLRSGWLDGLISLRIPGGGLRQTPESIDQDDHYSNGEAWLAMAAYCEHHRGDDRCGMLEDLDDAMIVRYSARPAPEFYHWGSMAAAQRFKTTGHTRFLAFMQQQGNFFFNRFQPPQVAAANRCASMEGVGAALAVLGQAGAEYAVLAGRMRSWLSNEADKLPRLQIQEGQTRLLLSGDASLTAPRLAAFTGDFLLGLYTPSVQVDATAHCMGAMVTIERDALLTRSSAP
ncbi:MAG: hypothetical protein QOK44_813 [Betaproteobacteria bacterium]|nr:hypothetical protein [Betaproteobacteria bacterium]